MKKDKKTLQVGKVVWVKNCASCHGDMSKGDGSKSKDLDSDPGGFGKKALQRDHLERRQQCRRHGRRCLGV